MNGRDVVTGPATISANVSASVFVGELYVSVISETRPAFEPRPDKQDKRDIGWEFQWIGEYDASPVSHCRLYSELVPAEFASGIDMHHQKCA